MSNAAQNGFNIQATLFFAPEDIQKVLEALKPVYERTIAEPECHSFQVYQLLDDPGQIRLVEDWETPLDRYMTERLKVDYMQELFAIIEPLFIKTKEVKVFNRLPQFGRLTAQTNMTLSLFQTLAMWLKASTFCDASGEVRDSIVWENKEDESLDVNHLAAVLREILQA